MLLGKGIIMSKKKVGRPKSKNVPYFPHYTESSNELTFLENSFGAEGYRAYYRLLEILTKTNDHFIKLETETQMLTFRYSMNVEKELLDKVIDYLVEMEFIDKHMYHEENIIWIQELVDCFKLVYYKRGRVAPQKVDNKIVSDTRNKQYSKQVTKELTKTTTTDDFDIYDTSSMVSKVIDSYKQDNPELDTDKTFYELKKRNPNPTPDDVMRFFDNALDKNMDLKQPDGIEIACSNCGDLNVAYSLEDVKETISECCKADWIYPN